MTDLLVFYLFGLTVYLICLCVFFLCVSKKKTHQKKRNTRHKAYKLRVQSERYAGEISDFRNYPVRVSVHAKERMSERMGLKTELEMLQRASDAFCYGKDVHQVTRSSAVEIKRIQGKYGHGVVYVYRGFIYIFSDDNCLITVYKDEKMLH